MKRKFIFFILLISIFSGCTAISSESFHTVSIRADGDQNIIQVHEGTSVLGAITQAGIILGNLDRLEPSSYIQITQDTIIQVFRVSEAFEIEEAIIPFERQIIQNESMPAGQERLIQPGINGVEQTTYRRLLQDGIEISRTVFDISITSEAIPEITMIGVQSPFSSESISGRLVYLVAGNAWMMEDTTSNRHPIVTSGDLDGHIFSLSPDGNWLLFTRAAESQSDDTINTLWAIDLNLSEPIPIQLDAINIVHFADWVPGRGTTIAYSTVEQRETSPGWQANNDLHIMTFTESGLTSSHSLVIDVNGGGAYGWWGTQYAWSPDGTELAYARPDSIGLVDLENELLASLLEIIPFNSRSDWAWVPHLGWSPDSNQIYITNHLPSEDGEISEDSSFFSISALALNNGSSLNIIPYAGMFANPTPSPYIYNGHYGLAYLQSILSDQSDISRYRLYICDRDGSNNHLIFPEDGAIGLEPQEIVWSPELSNSEEPSLIIIYQGNLWMINPITSEATQITGDHLTTRIDWR